MKDRVLKRRCTLVSLGLRRDLVHAAGCTERDCVSKAWIRDPEIVDVVRNEHGERNVSVPRSLRHLLGRWL